MKIKTIKTIIKTTTLLLSISMIVIFGNLTHNCQIKEMEYQISKKGEYNTHLIMLVENHNQSIIYTILMLLFMIISIAIILNIILNVIIEK